jgi:hypothetical protein
MRISRMISCAALTLLVAAAVPAQGNAQVGRLLKRAAKEAVTQVVVDKAASVTGVQPEPGSAALGARATPGPRFDEYLLEMTPDVLDRFDKGLAAEAAVRQEVERLIGKVLPPYEYDKCRDDVITGPEGQRVYMEAAEVLQTLAAQHGIQKASEELDRRMDRIVVPKCGLGPVEAQAIREKHADRLNAAAPQAADMTALQLYNLRERIVPLCKAMSSIIMGDEHAKVPTGVASVWWVYSPLEVEAAQPRCEKLMAALSAT